MKKFFLILVIPFLFSSKGIGQERVSNETRSFNGLYLDFGSGIYRTKIRDELFSPLLYKGGDLVFPRLKLHWRRNRFQLFSDFSLPLGILDQNVESDWVRTPEIDYAANSALGFLFNVRQWKAGKRNLWVGLNATMKWDILLNSRLGNSAINYYLIMGSSILGRLEFPFGWKAKDFTFFDMIHIHRKSRRLLFAWQLEYPFAGALARPSFDGIMYPAFDNPEYSSIMDDENFDYYILKPLYIRSEMELSYVLKNRNRLKMTYDWNYFHSKKYGLSNTFISYGLSFGFVFAF